MSGLLSELFALETVTGPNPNIVNKQTRLSVPDRQWTVVNQGWTHRQQEIYSLESDQDTLAFGIMRSYLEYSSQSGPPRTKLSENEWAEYGRIKEVLRHRCHMRRLLALLHALSASNPQELPEGDTVIYKSWELCLKSSGLSPRSVAVQL